MAMPGRRASSLSAARNACTQTPGLDRAMPGGERVYRRPLLEEEPLRPGRVFYPVPVAGQWVRISRVECTED
eukprot:11788810-Alexandrium_andersonii.AAC.1